MAERIKDAEDRLLESLFESPPVADDGFSAKIVSRINRRLWLRRLTLPVAMVIGGTIAFKPLAALVDMLASLSPLIPSEIVNEVTGYIPQSQIVVLGAMLLAVGLVTLRMLED